jgi:hypothetical protein
MTHRTVFTEEGRTSCRLNSWLVVPHKPARMMGIKGQNTTQNAI